eukprot:CAMPEP_0170606798 /NCGR_PEP_ID=MMETSP0224-20130122/20713_1 /TAXON_ID=285029 /ORGANISM="Togula jolla, Strain CCCM 725" /LENGTH=576 /DNA_ID=CAMNT_0010931921 /DNA_START=116 /DNA_END=1842 /DNA_ORIENTATION=+
MTMTRFAGVAALIWVLAPTIASSALSGAEEASAVASSQTSGARLEATGGSTLRKFRAFAEDSGKGVEDRHQRVESELQEDIQKAEDENVKAALKLSVTSNAQTLKETKKVYDNMVRFTDSMASLLEAATSKGYGCEQHTCGTHASCTDSTSGVLCVCNEGYVGDGQDCHAPPEFMPHNVLYEGAGGVKTQAADINVCVFAGNMIATVFRDASRGNIGRVVIGSVREAGMADLSPPEQFTIAAGKAYDPVVAGMDEKRLIITWRDENRGGTGWMRGVAIGTSSIRGADMAMKWGEPVNYARDQAHKAALVTVPQGRFALMFTDKAIQTQHTVVESFGAALLGKVQEDGVISVLQDKHRFTDSAVCRLEVTKISPTAFIVAARASVAIDDLDATVTSRQEAMAVFGMVDDHSAEGTDSSLLVFDPSPVNLEPTQEQIWARGVSLIAPNTFAYAYQTGLDSKLKMAVVEVAPQGHPRFKVVQQPVVIANGFSPYVSMLSVPYTPSDPHTLTYFERGNASMVNLCSWDSTGKVLHECEDFTWLSSKLSSVSGVHLGGGKAFMVFAPPSGKLYYSVFGLSK